MVIKDVLDIVLEDDSSPCGGIQYAGETVLDFILSCEEQLDIDVDDYVTELNDVLVSCGIKPLKEI